MAEEGAACATEDEPPAEFDMELVPHLPDGRAIVPAERRGKFAFLVATGAMTQQCFDEMRRHLQALVGSGRWRQNWGPTPPPEAEHGPGVAEFDMEIRPSLPDGAAILPDEQLGRFVWLVAAGAMTRQCFDEMRGYLLHIVGTGEWTQDWGGDPPPEPGH